MTPKPSPVTPLEDGLMEAINWTVLDKPERRRVYVFPGDVRIEFENVTKIEVRDSGKHRIETADGAKAFVAPGWYAILLDVDEWTC